MKALVWLVVAGMVSSMAAEYKNRTECTEKCLAEEYRACSLNEMGPGKDRYYCVSTWPLNPEELDQGRVPNRCPLKFWLGTCPAHLKCRIHMGGKKRATRCFKPLGYAPWTWILPVSIVAVFIIFIPIAIFGILFLLRCYRNRRVEKGKGSMADGQSNTEDSDEEKTEGTQSRDEKTEKSRSQRSRKSEKCQALPSVVPFDFAKFK